MNWARAKTILIFVFLVINIFLIFKVAERNNSNRINPEEISNLKNVLSQNKISLETSIPTIMKSLPRMKITNKVIDEKEIADKILGKGKWKKNTDQNKNLIYTADKKTLSFDKYGFIILSIDIDKSEMLKLCNQDSAENELLKRVNNYLPANKYKIDYYFKNEKETVINLSFLDNGNDVFNNDLTAEIFQEGKLIIRHGIIEGNGFSSKKKQVTVIDALIELVRNVGGTDETVINQISLGYYADLNKGDEIIKSGEANPAWRIKTNKGIFIFDGYSGAFLYKFDIENNKGEI